VTKIDHPVLIEPKSIPPFKSLAQGIGLFVIGIGCLVLAGWVLDIAVLKSIVPGLATMKSMTALLFVLSGISLWLQAKAQAHQFALVCAFIVTVASVLTLGEYLFSRDFGIDQLVFREPAVGVLYPGRMAPVTGLSFLLISSALLFLDRRTGDRFKEFPVIAVFALSLLAVIGYIYAVSSLYRIGAYTSMALHTALSFVVLSMGILFARPERGLLQTILADTAGGYILRRFLPMALVLPVILGWIRLWGQRAGFYDTAFGLAIMVTSLITTLTIFIWVNAGQLTNIDGKRRQVEIEIIKLNTELEEKVARRTSELAAANEQLHQLSIMDELTGLHNRRGFMLLAEEQLLHAKRTRRNLLVFYADLDGLKQINDQYGHIVGDEAILTAAHALNQTFRTSDIKARLGGDEFIVLAVDAKEHDAQPLLAHLHERFAENNLSISVGVIAFDAKDETSIQDLVARADKAMYSEKRRKQGNIIDKSRAVR